MSDINALMQRDPLKLTKDDVRAIVDEMRKSRNLFNSAPKVMKEKVVKVSAAEAGGAKLSLADLGI